MSKMSNLDISIKCEMEDSEIEVFRSCAIKTNEFMIGDQIKLPNGMWFTAQAVGKLGVSFLSDKIYKDNVPLDDIEEELEYIKMEIKSFLNDRYIFVSLPYSESIFNKKYRFQLMNDISNVVCLDSKGWPRPYYIVGKIMKHSNGFYMPTLDTTWVTQEGFLGMDVNGRNKIPEKCGIRPLFILKV